jgi:hypothetical protein
MEFSPSTKSNTIKPVYSRGPIYSPMRSEVNPPARRIIPITIRGFNTDKISQIIS